MEKSTLVVKQYCFMCYPILFLSDGMVYWKEERLLAERTSTNIERTAYVLLAHLEFTVPSQVGRHLPIARWLVKQRNYLGGWISTQVGFEIELFYTLS